MRKIVFIEPYVSLGAHNYRHISRIPSQCDKADIDYTFIAERKTHYDKKNRRISCILEPFHSMNSLDFSYITDVMV